MHEVLYAALDSVEQVCQGCGWKKSRANPASSLYEVCDVIPARSAWRRRRPDGQHPRARHQINHCPRQ